MLRPVLKESVVIFKHQHVSMCISRVTRYMEFIKVTI